MRALARCVEVRFNENLRTICVSGASSSMHAGAAARRPPPQRRPSSVCADAVAQILMRASKNMLNGKFGKVGSYGVARNGWMRSPGLYWLPAGSIPPPEPYVDT